MAYNSSGDDETLWITDMDISSGDHVEQTIHQTITLPLAPAVTNDSYDENEDDDYVDNLEEADMEEQLALNQYYREVDPDEYGDATPEEDGRNYESGSNENDFYFYYDEDNAEDGEQYDDDENENNDGNTGNLRFVNSSSFYAIVSRLLQSRRRRHSLRSSDVRKRQLQAAEQVQQMNLINGERLLLSGEFGNHILDIIGTSECRLRTTSNNWSSSIDDSLQTQTLTNSNNDNTNIDNNLAEISTITDKTKRPTSISDMMNGQAKRIRAEHEFTSAQQDAVEQKDTTTTEINVLPQVSELPVAHASLSLRGRELNGRSRTVSNAVSARCIPNTKGQHVLKYNANPYCSQFSDDGNFFYSCTQDFRVHIYDSSDVNHLAKVNTVAVPAGRWTVTDAVYIAPTVANEYSDKPWMHTQTTPTRLEFGTCGNNEGFGIWSIRFSHDNREILAGTSVNDSHTKCVYVYDVERRQVLLHVEGHHDDVNAVCWADKSSHVLFSGSDDSTIKVWDRRSMSSRSTRPCGVLCGHTEGLTYLSSKGDGRYCLSNGKDQSMKLWDIRKMMSTSEFNTLPDSQRRCRENFDYRSEEYSYNPLNRHKHDCSVLTMTGHSVLVTLIRCHFAPSAMNGRYFVSGSKDGIVRVWNLYGHCVSEMETVGSSVHQWRRQSVVRDVSWHPFLPIIMSTTWSSDSNSYGHGGAIMKHEFEPHAVRSTTTTT